MSLAPTWFSTLWAGWSFSIMMQSLFAFLLLCMFLLKSSDIGAFIKGQQFHDIGKLLYGFSIFYAYLTFAHVLTYWYINMPEETSYFLTRLEKPWLYLVLVSPVLNFLFPLFIMIPKSSKFNPKVYIPISVLILVSQWLNYVLIVIPEVTTASTWKIPWLEFGIMCGFTGLFLSAFFRFSSRNPMLSIGDPLLHQSFQDSH